MEKSHSAPTLLGTVIEMNMNFWFRNDSNKELWHVEGLILSNPFGCVQFVLLITYSLFIDGYSAILN